MPDAYVAPRRWRGRTPARLSPGSAQSGHLASRLLLFVPVGALLAFTLWQRSAVPEGPVSFGEPDEPLRTGQVGSIDGWEARVVREDASPLRVRLERLHPEPGRQSFDAAALGQTLGLPLTLKGERAEPWRLSLSIAARPGAKPENVVVTDVSGVQLVGLLPAVASRMGGAGGGTEDASEEARLYDPLETLLRPTNATLLEGEACALIFWGPEPVGPVRAEVPGIGTVELLPKTRNANQSSGSIARLDGRSGAKASGGAPR